MKRIVERFDSQPPDSVWVGKLGSNQSVLKELTGHIPLNLEQSRLIKIINFYLNKNYGMSVNEAGLCQGLSAIYCYYASQNKEDEFFEQLERITTSTKKELTTPDLKLSYFLQQLTINIYF